MRPIHAVAAVAIAFLGLGFAAPLAAAPQGGPAAASAQPWAGDASLILVDRGDHDRRRWRHRDRDDWDDHDRRRGEWDRDHRHRDDGWDRGRHRGWDRGRGHDWHFGRNHGKDWRWGRGRDSWDDDRWRHRHDGKRWNKDARWRLHHHPQHRRWVGRHFEWRRYDHIRDHARYGLRPPAPGYFYARVDDDVFLVAEGTWRIVDAWLLLGAARR